MSAEQFSEANKRTIQNIVAMPEPKGVVCKAGYLVLWGHEEIAEALGIVAMTDAEKETEPAYFRWPLTGKEYTGYKTEKNATNRPLTIDNMQRLLAFMLAEKWAITGEFMIFDESGMAASAQHRLTAAFIATLINPDLRFYFLILGGIAVDVIDLIDTGKSRDLKDVSARHTDSFLPLDTLRDIHDNPIAGNALEVRKQQTGDIKQAMSIVWHRAHGKDVNASTSGDYKDDRAHYIRMLERFEPMVFTDANGVEVESTSLERAAMRIYNHDRGTSKTGGALSKYFGRGKVLAALILASNHDNDSVVTTIPAKTKGGNPSVSVEMPDTLALDLDLVELFCKVATQPTGSFAPLYSTLDQYKGKEKLDAQYRFGALVNAIKYLEEHVSDTVVPATLNQAGEVIKPERIEQTVEPMPANDNGRVIGIIPKAPAKKAGMTKAPALNFPAFGGLDIGPIDKKALAAEATIAEAQEEAASMEEVEA